MGFKWGLENFNHSLDEKVEKVERVFPDKYKIKNEEEKHNYDKVYDAFERNKKRAQILGEMKKVMEFFKEGESTFESFLKMEPTDEEDIELISDAVNSSIEIYNKYLDEYKDIIYITDLSKHEMHSDLGVELENLRIKSKKEKVDKLIENLKEKYIDKLNENVKEESIVEENKLEEDAYNYGSELNEKYSVLDKDEYVEEDISPEILELFE